MTCSNVGDNTSPSHYKQGQYETIDIIKDMMTDEMFEGYLLGNVIKYMARYNFKNGAEDLGKAQTYLRWLVEHVKEQEVEEITVKAEGSI